jgi:hypothetical protein
MKPESALIAAVPEAEPLINSFRQRSIHLLRLACRRT